MISSHLAYAIAKEHGELEKTAFVRRGLRSFFNRGFESLPKHVQKGLEAEARAGRGGPHSLFMMPAEWAAGKAFGKKRVEDALWKYLQKPSHSLNISAGKKLRKLPFGKTLFTEKRPLPVKTLKGGRVPDKTIYEDMQMPAATGPLTKGMEFATPVIVGMALDKGVRKLKGDDKKPEGMK